MPTSTQSVSLLERRIIELLTTTNLTFKEIILKLDGENLSASIGIIRRINRDNRYRRPRYDSKLTPAQRESLVEELRDHQDVKPNLSLLAKRYGVCHGSVWYWWDKLNRVKRCNSHSSSSSSSPSSTRGPCKTKGLFKRWHQMQLLSQPARLHQNELMEAKELIIKPRPKHNNNNLLLDGRVNLVGRVNIVACGSVGAIELPIMMFSSNTCENERPLMEPIGLQAVELPLVDGEPAAQQLAYGKMFSLHNDIEAISLIKVQV